MKGGKELANKLKALAKATGDLEAAGLAGGLIIQAAAVKKAPYKTGTLRRSIVVRVQASGLRITVAVGTNLVYARRIEYGYRGRDSLGRSYNQAAQPFLRPAFDEEKSRAIAEIRNVIERLLKNV